MRRNNRTATALAAFLASALCAQLGATIIPVTSPLDTGPGTLRMAIVQANLTPGRDTIVFNIGGGGPQTITPFSALPALTDPAGVLIDGFTQPGAMPGPQPPATAVPLIELDGTFAGVCDGLSIESDGNTVQGLVINRFQGDGIRIVGGRANPSADFNVIFANFVGTDLLGAIDLGNGVFGGLLGAGIHIGNLPGGQAIHNTVDGNLASGNWSEGIWIEGPRQPGSVGWNQVLNNFVGTDISGTLDVGNDHQGIPLTEGTVHNHVDRNLVSGNDYDGIGLQGFNNAGFPVPPIQTQFNHITRNTIGLDINLNPLPNTMHGVAVGEYGPSRWGCADQNAIIDNVIAFNGGAGVSVVEDWIDPFNADGNRISRNAIWANMGLGIDLGNNGVTPNDPGDLDQGPNQELNFPLITGVSFAAGITTIQGSLQINGNPALATIEIFWPQADPSMHGEGQWFLGAVTCGPAGNWSFTTDRLTPSDFVTATATDLAGNTSEYCLNARVPGAPTLFASTRTLPARLGGTVNLAVNAGTARANRMYVVLGSLSGVQPGTPLGLVTVPLNWDPWSAITLMASNTPVFANFFGTLDGMGNTNAQLNLPPMPAQAVGLTMYYACVLLNPIDFATNHVAVDFVGW